jgi:hypothetical protein|tara:strand:- start:2176 stop:3633 length:1458 start_codon:yes stop_codon:yes gene_type:complete
MTTDNTTVPSLPLQLQNPNLFSTNKVGVQVNNYLITDEALMADPFLLEANKSLRPDNKGFLAVKLNFANCKQSDYVLTTDTPIPENINRSGSPDLSIVGKFLLPFASKLPRAFGILGGVFRKNSRQNDVFGKGKQLTTDVTEFTVDEDSTVIEKIKSLSDKEVIANYSSLKYFQVAPYNFNTNRNAFEQDNKAEFFAELLQRGFLQFTPDGGPNAGDPEALKQFRELDQDFPYQNDKIAQLIGKNVHNTLHQSFMVFDYSKGTQKLESSDTIVSASLRLKVKSHFGERNIPSHVFASQLTSLFGDLKCEPRTFEVARVKKDIASFSASSDKHNPDQAVKAARSPSPVSFNPSDFTNKWDSPYGTGPKDIDVTRTSQFTIDKPLKQGDFVDIDITELLRDAIANRSQVLRIVIRPKSNYDDTGFIHIGNDGYVSEGGNGQGNHWFEFFDEPGDRPKVTIKALLDTASSRSRINSFKKTGPNVSITK